ncbi:MAG TPA: hypothetical protein V6C97_21070 [Oculatellaceae cyanobacterium]
MVGMFTFQILQWAIQRAKNTGDEDDARELTEMFMKLTDSTAEVDAVFRTTERVILEALISDELKSANEPSFANICEKPWTSSFDKNEFLIGLSEASKKAVRTSVQSRLGTLTAALAIVRHSRAKTAHSSIAQRLPGREQRGI